VLCFALGQNGEVISGDSNGNIFIWANGKFGFGKTHLKVMLTSSATSYPKILLSKAGFLM
jgi:hypothetical protein